MCPFLNANLVFISAGVSVWAVVEIFDHEIRYMLDPLAWLTEGDNWRGVEWAVCTALLQSSFTVFAIYNFFKLFLNIKFCYYINLLLR